MNDPTALSQTATAKASVPMPIDALPGIISQFTSEATAIDCDPAAVAVPLLTCLASAIGSKRVVRLRSGRVEPATIWGGVIDDGGNQWRIGFEAATATLQRMQREAFAAHAAAIRQYESEMGWHALYLRQWRDFGRRYERPIEPDVPVAERFIVSDTRLETLIDRLALSPTGLAMLNHDLTDWIGRFDVRPDKRSILHSIWRGQPLAMDRRNQTIYIEHPSISMAGGIKPAAFRRILASEDCEDRLISRLLVTMPSSQRVAKCSDAAISPATEAELAELLDVLWTLPFHSDANGQPIPSEVGLSQEAGDEWIQFANRHRAEKTELTGYLAGVWASLEAYAARFALVFHFCRRAEGQAGDPLLIDAETLQAAIRLVDWFGQEAHRVYTLFGPASRAEDSDERTIALIRRRKGRITARELRQFDRRFRHDGASAEAELDRLAESNYGRWEAVGGRRRTREFVLAASS